MTDQSFQDIPPAIWALVDDRTGNASQCLGVAEALGLPFLKQDLRYTAAGALPNWLRTGNGFTDTRAQVKVSGDSRTSTLRVYAKSYPAGTVSDLAGNLAAGASGANSNYLVIVKP